MIDGSEKRNRQLAFEFQNSCVFEKNAVTNFFKLNFLCQEHQNRFFFFECKTIDLEFERLNFMILMLMVKQETRMRLWKTNKAQS